jgi:hypothetical protein
MMAITTSNSIKVKAAREPRLQAVLRSDLISIINPPSGADGLEATCNGTQTLSLLESQFARESTEPTCAGRYCCEAFEPKTRLCFCLCYSGEIAQGVGAPKGFVHSDFAANRACQADAGNPKLPASFGEVTDAFAH